jgi:hypothetical protein
MARDNQYLSQVREIRGLTGSEASPGMDTVNISLLPK